MFSYGTEAEIATQVGNSMYGASVILTRGDQEVLP